MKKIYLKVTGLVQGVFFRANTKKQADILGIKGFIRNTPDKGIEIMAQGNKKTLDEFINWCHKGPTGARVDHVDIKWENDTEKIDDFKILY